MRFRVPTMRKPARWCSRQLSMFLGEDAGLDRPDPGGVGAAGEGRQQRAACTVALSAWVHVDGVLDDAAAHGPGWDRTSRHPAQHLTGDSDGHVPVQGQFPLVEDVPAGGGGLEAGVAGVQPGLLDGEHLVRVVRFIGRIRMPASAAGGWPG